MRLVVSLSALRAQTSPLITTPSFPLASLIHRVGKCCTTIHHHHPITVHIRTLTAVWSMAIFFSFFFAPWCRNPPQVTYTYMSVLNRKPPVSIYRGAALAVPFGSFFFPFSFFALVKRISKISAPGLLIMMQDSR
ncbi:hypothetical protein F4778DRAFT_703860 [Xylariomycetidae sp. FL2044]|nr:hypothetical protein F4778DRAFT_703860 [Xylariomycetidae sp. FL2044]